MTPPFELGDHDADILIAASGATAEEALASAVAGLSSCVTDLDTVEPRETRRVEVEGGTGGELLVRWLKGWLAHLNGSGFVAREVVVQEAGPHRVAGEGRGETLDPARHRLMREVKAVTWHGAFFGREGDAWHARAVVDV